MSAASPLGRRSWSIFRYASTEIRSTPFTLFATTGIQGRPSWAQMAHGKGKHWIIDGREDNVPAGTIYKIRFEWDDYTKEISWEPDVTPNVFGDGFEHTFAVVGSWSNWAFQEMTLGFDRGVHEFSATMPRSGEFEFQIVRDRDWGQTVYPALPRASKQHVPVAGPDDEGHGRNFLFRAVPGEVVRISLRILDGGDLAVTAQASGAEAVTWESGRAVPPQTYHITGPFNSGASATMRHTGIPGVYAFEVVLGASGEAAFQILSEGEASQVIYPADADAASGASAALGPDGLGQGQHWCIRGQRGERYRVILNLNEENPRQIVTWSCTDDERGGIPAFRQGFLEDR